MTLRRYAPPAVALAVLLSSACATVRTADRRSDELAAYFTKNPFPRSCDAMWPAALKVAAARGFGLSSSDRVILGESKEGAITQLVSAATQTYRAQDGGLVTETDWNRGSGTRLRIRAAPAGEQACTIRYDVIGGGVTTPDELQLGPDWSLALDLLRAEDPARATALEATLPD